MSTFPNARFLLSLEKELLKTCEIKDIRVITVIKSIKNYKKKKKTKEKNYYKSQQLNLFKS